MITVVRVLIHKATVKYFNERVYSIFMRKRLPLLAENALFRPNKVFIRAEQVIFYRSISQQAFSLICLSYFYFVELVTSFGVSRETFNNGGSYLRFSYQ